MKHFTAFTTITLLLTITVTLLTVGGCSEEEEPAMFVEVTPANGSTIKEREVIIVTFNRPPEELTITGGDFSLSDYLFSDASVEIRGPFTPGAINITLTWTGGRKRSRTSLNRLRRIPKSSLRAWVRQEI